MVETDVHARDIGTESEVGATTGEKHDDILVRTLGRERGLRVAIQDGPPAVREK